METLNILGVLNMNHLEVGRQFLPLKDLFFH